MSTSYQSPELFIGGHWQQSGLVASLVHNPATGETIAEVPKASVSDLDDALAASADAFEGWRRSAPQMRAGVLQSAAALIRERVAELARQLTLEQGKTLQESKQEFLLAAEAFEWYAAQALRADGRVLPSRTTSSRQLVLPQPLGPVAAFTPWNFPAALPARKIAAALAAGCTMVLKPSEETPASALALARALDDAGLPKGVLNVVFGIPAQVSKHLIGSNVIRKVTFTGSTEVGREIARLAAERTIPCTLELGGHAPVLVFDDADLDVAVSTCVVGKSRNAGQVCTSPTRFIVQDGIYRSFVEAFGRKLDELNVGAGLDTAVQMGPLANERRLAAMQDLVTDAIEQGGKLMAGGNRVGTNGYLWRPTLIADAPHTAKAMSQEPFGPMALANRFQNLEDGLAEANRLSFGLAAYAFTNSCKTANAVSNELKAGSIGINSFSVSQIEAPFGGVLDSGYGAEGGVEGLESFMHPKFVHHVV